MSTNHAASSSKLWATASKEWVIQPKPKPGRKPKKDASHVKADNNEVDADDGRRIQNRAAQRAFRERKQSQLAELQARVQLYEQGEIERNVALQNIAKKLKEENEGLRKENQDLKQKVSILELGVEPSKKRTRALSPPSESLKKSRPYLDTSETQPLSCLPSPPSLASSPDSNDAADSPPVPSEDHTIVIQTSEMNLLQFASSTKQTSFDGNGFPPFDCGFCSEDTPCVCREFVAQQVQVQAEQVEEYKVTNGYGISNMDIDLVTHPLHLDLTPAPSRPSILDELPAYQPPVPLRRKALSSGNTVFAVTPSTQPAVPTCTGDPSNCMACADDSFGKAFCAAINESVANSAPCPNCPCLQGQCAGGNQTQTQTQTHLPTNEHQGNINSSHTVPETMPTNDAWRQLKSHPNVDFADLSLLADVVARRSTCPGPSALVSSTVDSRTPQGDHMSTEHERVPVRSQSPPKLVPQDVLMRCARQRVREVETDAVRAALRLLDAKFV